MSRQLSVQFFGSFLLERCAIDITCHNRSQVPNAQAVFKSHVTSQDDIRVHVSYANKVESVKTQDTTQVN